MVLLLVEIFWLLIGAIRGLFGIDAFLALYIRVKILWGKTTSPFPCENNVSVVTSRFSLGA